MSDSITKYYELVEEGVIQDKTPSKDYTSYKLASMMDDEQTIKQAYTILSLYEEGAILKAARILDDRK